MVIAMFRIRRATDQDGAGIYAAHAAAVRVTCRSHYGPEDVESWANRLRPWAYRDDLERRDVVVAEDGERVLGFGVLDAEGAQIRAVYVHPEAGRRGVGGAILQVLERLARLRGLTEARLDSSLNAVAFYAANGWRQGGDTIHTFPGGRDIPCVVMTKTLPAGGLALRDERPVDRDAIGAVERAAFGRDGEAEVVDRLRQAGALALSLVAVLDGQIVGHLALSPVRIAGAGTRVLGLGPMAVTPLYQGAAIGSRLVEEGLARARERGFHGVVVLGHPEFYPRFGFVPASRAGLRYPDPVPDDAFMAAELAPNAFAACEGEVHYHPAFGAVTNPA
jgi:putative acetyltransferase